MRQPRVVRFLHIQPRYSYTELVDGKNVGMEHRTVWRSGTGLEKHTGFYRETTVIIIPTPTHLLLKHDIVARAERACFVNFSASRAIITQVCGDSNRIKNKFFRTIRSVIEILPRTIVGLRDLQVEIINSKIKN